VELRKAKKEEQLSKRRNIDTDETDDSSSFRNANAADDHKATEKNRKLLNDENLQRLIADINR